MKSGAGTPFHADRPQCSVYIATSLDGFIARPDGSLDWLSMVQHPGEDYGYRRFFDSVDGLIIGRRTYDTVLGFPSWPYANKRCVVLTHNPPAARRGESFHAGDPTTLLARLRADGVRRVYVDGGAVIRSFLQVNSVDDLTLSIIPVILGDGIRLFENGGAELRLRLKSSQAFSSGLVQVSYERADAT
jgi:dihydrofolate reductase